MMAKSTRSIFLLVAVLLAAVAEAFVARPASSLSSTTLSAPSPLSSSVHRSSSASSSSSKLDMSDKPEIEVVSQPDDDFLKSKGVFDWGTWGCGVSKFPWSYDSTESCYLLAGKVTVTPDDGRKPATFGKGDFVTFPAGMSCTWDVTEAVNKHFMFF
mmetsp:Transcript_22891/g.39164  ORF Transcript_22891/g.39164 Transcript_22891/m.39164 type:complete len:157 (-) Transcript_22891:320-790(-)